jgi:hypothetical protein
MERLRERWRGKGRQRDREIFKSFERIQNI